MKKQALSRKVSGRGNRKTSRGRRNASGGQQARVVGKRLVVGALVIVGIGVVSFSFVSIYHYLIHSSHLKLKEVKVEGVDEVIGNDLIRMGRLNSDQSLWGLNLRGLRREMEKHPWVRTVTLERRFPHTLVVRGEQQHAYALAAMKGLYYVNRHGEVFKKLDPGDEADYPVITGLTGSPGDAARQLKRAVEVLEVLEFESGPWSLQEVLEIHVTAAGGVSLYFSHLGAEIKLGTDDLASKMEGLKKVTEHLRQQGRIGQVKGIDLNHRGEAMVSFRKG